MFNQLANLGRGGIQYLLSIGFSGVFLFRAVTRRAPKGHSIVGAIVRQIYFVGFFSVIIIVLSGLFIGMVVALQGFHTLEKFGATSQLGQLVALSVTRELAPVVAGLLFVGRAGSALAAEIGLMKATDQLTAMEMMAVDPLVKVVAPRFWAGVISLPILTILFMVIAIWGGHLVGVSWLGIDNGAFWSTMQSTVLFGADVMNGVLKSLVFAAVVTWVAVYQGYTAEPNSAGVARATTRTVVYGSVLILAFDFVLTALMMGGW